MLKIRELRIKKGLTGPQLAEMLHISTQYLYDMERGKRRIHSDMLSKLADIFGTSIDYLVGRTKDPLPPSSSQTDYSMEHNFKLAELINETAKLPEDQQELIAGGWKWALDVIRRQESYKSTNKHSLNVKEEKEKKYKEESYPKEDDDIDVRSTPMAAHLEDGESVPLTPELEEMIKDGIKESRRIKRERKSQQEGKQEKPNTNDEKDTTDKK